MMNDKELPDTSRIVDWLKTKREIIYEFEKIIRCAPDDIDWGSETEFEIKWTKLIKETENKINEEFPDVDREQQVEAVRIFAQEISQN